MTNDYPPPPATTPPPLPASPPPKSRFKRTRATSGHLVQPRAKPPVEEQRCCDAGLECRFFKAALRYQVSDEIILHMQKFGHPEPPHSPLLMRYSSLPRSWTSASRLANAACTSPFNLIRKFEREVEGAEDHTPPRSLFMEVKLYTISTCGIDWVSGAETNERRLRHILDSKLIDYEVIMIDLQPTFASVLQIMSGSKETPQLHLVYHNPNAVSPPSNSQPWWKKNIPQQAQEAQSPEVIAHNYAEVMLPRWKVASVFSKDLKIYEQPNSRTVVMDYRTAQELEDELRLDEMLQLAKRKPSYDDAVAMWDYERVYYERARRRVQLAASILTATARMVLARGRYKRLRAAVLITRTVRCWLRHRRKVHIKARIVTCFIMTARLRRLQQQLERVTAATVIIRSARRFLTRRRRERGRIKQAARRNQTQWLPELACFPNSVFSSFACPAFLAVSSSKSSSSSLSSSSAAAAASGAPSCAQMLDSPYHYLSASNSPLRRLSSPNVPLAAAPRVRMGYRMGGAARTPPRPPHLRSRLPLLRVGSRHSTPTRTPPRAPPSAASLTPAQRQRQWQEMQQQLGRRQTAAALCIQCAVRQRSASKAVRSRALAVYEKLYDEQSELYYYYNTATDDSVWTKPKILKEVDAPLAQPE